jgi:hypothetical protein
MRTHKLAGSAYIYACGNLIDHRCPMVCCDDSFSEGTGVIWSEKKTRNLALTSPKKYRVAISFPTKGFSAHTKNTFIKTAEYGDMMPHARIR